MKQFYLSTLILFSFSITAFAVGSDVEVPVASEEILYGVPFGKDVLTVEDILAHKPRQLAKKHGVKFNFKQRVALSVVRGKLKRAKRKGHDLHKAYDDAGSSNFHVGGFILGFFLGLLGWILAILIWPRIGAGRSAILGFAIWLIVALLIFA